MIRLNDINLLSISLRGISLSRISLGGSSGGGVPPVPPLRPIASYRTAGKTNQDADRDVLKDLTGHGYDIQLKNFGFAFGSGYGVYDTNVSSIVMNSSDYSITVKSLDNSPKIRIAFSVSGLPNEDPGFNYLRISIRASDQSLIYDQVYRYDGEYVFEWENTNNESFYCVIYNGGSPSYSVDGLKVLIHPNEYEGALVSDGVDDYGLCTDFPSSLFSVKSGYTIIAKRVWIEQPTNNCSLVTMLNGNSVGPLAVEYYSAAQDKFRAASFGNLTEINKSTSEVVYQTSKSYNGAPISIGSNLGNIDRLVIFAPATNITNSSGKIALYALDIYDRDLEGEELQTALII